MLTRLYRIFRMSILDSITIHSDEIRRIFGKSESVLAKMSVYNVLARFSDSANPRILGTCGMSLKSGVLKEASLAV